MSDDDDDDEIEVGAMQGAPSATAISPTWTWGSSARIHIESAVGGPAVFVAGTSQQLMQVSLPEPAVCSIYFQANLTASNPANNLVQFTVNLNEGVGRVTVIRDLTYLSQPALNSPLEVTVPFVPVHALNVDVTALANIAAPNSSVDVEVIMVISPLTRIPQKIQKLQFGMGLPGEADDLDDELRAELETEGPTVQQMMMQGRKSVDGSDGLERVDDDDDDDAQQVQRTPAWLMTLIDQMTRRLGRQPTRPELAKAVRRVQARVARRRAR